MKKKLYILALLALASLMPLSVQGATLSQNLSGRLLLQVEAHGEAWYVYPGNRLRYFMGRPADAFALMRGLGLGISEADYQRFQDNPPSKLLGRIMLRVHANGEAYYVDPVNKEFRFLGRPADAFALMRELALGINNNNLARMPISGASIIPPNGVMAITIAEPDWNASIPNPVTISGQARVFENTVNIRVRNSNDKILANTFTTAQSPDVGQFGPYEKSVSYSTPGTSSGYIEVFNESAQDGSEINKVIMLIRF